MRSRHPFRLASASSWLFACIAAAAVAACSQKENESTKRATPSRPDASAGTSSAPSDAGATAAIADAAAGPYDGPYIGALFAATPIMSDMEWPIKDELLRPGEKQRSFRIGYVRQGGKVPVIPEAHKKPNCLDGWYELVQGGFVCGRYASLDLNHPKIRTAPRPPDVTGALPYPYGINLRNGTPLYKHIPSREERLRYEPWLSAPVARPARPQHPHEEEDPEYAAEDLDAGALVQATATGGLAMATTADPLALGTSEPDDSGVPWYLREYDGGKPSVTLDELREDGDGGPIEKRMVKGFYLSLDKQDTHFGAKWWRTQSRLFTPFERVYLPKMATEFHGVWLNQDPPSAGEWGAPAAAVTADAGLPPLRRIEKLPVGFITQSRAKKYTLSEDGKKMIAGEHVGRFSILGMTGQTKVVERVLYEETDEGWWMRSYDGTSTKPGPAPKDLLPGEKWIDVNLLNETLVAFEGDKPVYATIISSGKRDLKDKEKDHPTKNGTFRIREKHIAATMDADTASDGPYSIEDVPWIQYFNGSIALHGAFWHSNFGHTQSHGCVNLSPWDAKALFGWTEPRLPEGWHGVAATEERPGTRVILHDEKPPIKDLGKDVAP
jgi:hypothetical protein